VREPTVARILKSQRFLATCSAGFSIYGLTAIFAGAFSPASAWAISHHAVGYAGVN